MKRLQGIIAATVITIIVSLGMVVIGADAATNVNSVPVNNSPNGVPAAASLASSGAGSTTANTTAQTAQDSAAAAQDAQFKSMQAQIDQLQSQIKQYQSREQQYQTEIKSLSQQLVDANATANQAQQVLQALQERGIIQITRDGRIFLRGD